MAVTATRSYPHDSGAGNVVTEPEWGKLIRAVDGDGHRIDGLAVTPGTGLAVDVAAGQGIVGGAYARWDAASTLTVAPNVSGVTRTDRVVMRLDRTADRVELDVITGTAVVSTDNVTEATIALVEVPSAAVAVTVAGILPANSTPHRIGFNGGTLANGDYNAVQLPPNTAAASIVESAVRTNLIRNTHPTKPMNVFVYYSVNVQCISGTAGVPVFAWTQIHYELNQSGAQLTFGIVRNAATATPGIPIWTAGSRSDFSLLAGPIAPGGEVRVDSFLRTTLGSPTPNDGVSQAAGYGGIMLLGTTEV